MQISGDTHTHTIICQHAYSTLSENCARARQLGHRFIAHTEHGPALPGAPYIWYFDNIARVIPREEDGLVNVFGCEANILDITGRIDIGDRELSRLDLVIASIHNDVLENAGVGYSRDDFTSLWRGVIDNPGVDVLGHLGDGRFMPDYDEVLAYAAKKNKLVEINSSSPRCRVGSQVNCKEIVRLCKKHRVKLLLSSDAHYYSKVGDVEWSIRLVEEVDYPEELVINTDYARFRAELLARKGVVLPE